MGKLTDIELEARQEIINEAIERFIDDNEIDIADKNITVISNRLQFIFKDKKSISTSKIHDYLQEIYDYNETNRDYRNKGINVDEEDAIDSITSILVTAAPKKEAFTAQKKWIIIVVIVLALSASVLTLHRSTTIKQEAQQTIADHKSITLAQAKELKALVAEVVKAEKENSNKTTTTGVWNEVKKIKALVDLGYKASYKDFNHAQYIIAKDYLNDWIKKGKSAKPKEQHKTFKITASEIIISDGDTFKTKTRKFRLWGVDAFELKQHCFDKNKNLYPCGEHAKTELENILNNAKDITCTETATDRYKRTIARCYVDLKELGQLLTKSGWAVDYTKYSGGHFKTSEETAKHLKAGAWQGCFVMPWDYRHKDNLDICE